MGKWITKTLLPVLIMAFGIGLGTWLMTHPQKAKKRPPMATRAALVETGMPESGDFAAQIEVMGRVIPAQQVLLKAQVGGEIIDAADEFIPGGRFRKNDHVLSIDPADYALAVKKQEAILKQVEADYKLEQGRQDIARDELAILTRTTGRMIDKPALALREPQLEQAQAELEKARSDLEIAKLNLQRTEVTAPFNAMVIERTANAGNKISPQETLATLVNTDAYWVEISVPVAALQWLDIPGNTEDSGSSATLLLNDGRGTREGRLLRASGTLDPDSRLASLLVEVKDPLLLNEGANGTPLIIGDYVRVAVTGRKIENALRIPQAWLRDDNMLWVLDDENNLDFRKVEVVFEDRDYAYISGGIETNDVIVTSDIAVPAPGMKLRHENNSSASDNETLKGEKQ